MLQSDFKTCTLLGKKDHISLRVSLNWLIVKSRIEFKILLLAYKSLIQLLLKDLIAPYTTTGAGLLVLLTIGSHKNQLIIKLQWTFTTGGLTSYTAQKNKGNTKKHPTSE